MEQKKNHRSGDGILLEEIMLDILIRLPVKSLLRFRSVCKHWKSLITSSSFNKLHRQRHSSSLPLILTCHDSSYGIGDDEPGMMGYYLTAFNLYGKFIQKHTLPISSEDLEMLSVPSQSKLLCFECYNCVECLENTLFSYNPSTRQLFRLPEPPCFSLPDFKHGIPTFGYIPSKDEYILMIMVGKNSLKTWICEVLTFSISNDNFQLHYNEWRSIEVTSMLSSTFVPSGVFVCGVFYLEARDENGNVCILSFDVETEVFLTFRLPQEVPFCTLLELKEELYVMSESEDSLILNLWKLCTNNDDNGNKSWTLYKTINLKNLGFTDTFNDQSKFDWKIFIYRLEYLQCYNEPSNVLLEMGMLKLENDVLDVDDEYYMPPQWSVNIHTNLFTL